MEVNFLNQKPCIPSWPGAFQFDILYSVVLSKSMSISVLGPSSYSSSSLVILFIHSAFLLRFLVAIFLSKIVRFLLQHVVVMFSCHSLPIMDIIFLTYHSLPVYTQEQGKYLLLETKPHKNGDSSKVWVILESN